LRSPFANSPGFRRLLEADARADLTAIALEIARDAYPDLDIDANLARINALADRVRARCRAGASHVQVLKQINWVLFIEEGFRGNTDDYYDARNSYLNEVLDRKTGIPISLSILYLALAERLGVPMAGVGLPYHFVVCLRQESPALYVDPFHSGTFLDRAGCQARVEGLSGKPVALSEEQLAPCTTAEIVARMLRNLKSIHLRSHDWPAALPVLRRLAILCPEDAAEQRDLGMVCLYAGKPGEAVGPLESYLKAHPEAEDAEAIEGLLRAARQDLAQRN
jgi:regulator of sirC expression with transglutaminase-like and TPR domain